MSKAFDYSVDTDGVATVVFDLPGKRVNLWSLATLEEFETTLSELSQHEGLVAVLFRSGKPDTFIAGADVEELAAVRSSEEATRLARRGQKTFQRVADLSVPTVAVIHGACVGGGLEFALACSFRVASDDLVTRIGFPETQLGIIPAWGGTQRTARLVGLQEALKLILTARRLTARQAAKLGVVDQAVPKGRLDEIAHDTVRAAAGGKAIPGGTSSGLQRLVLDRNPIGRRLLFSQSRKRVKEKTGLHYPAPLAAIEVMEIGQAEGMTAGLEAEARVVGELAMTPAARNLMWLYKQRESAKSPPGGGVAKPVRRLAVVGAGVMGGAIAEVAAYREIGVRLKDVDNERLAAGLGHAAKIALGLRKRGKLSSREVRNLMNRVSGTTAYTGFGTVDLVIEAIVEDLEIKRRVLAELEREVPGRAFLATNTSSLSVDALAEVLQWPERFGGLHFFNPVERMPLVEIVQGSRTSSDCLTTLHALALKLGKTPVVVRDSPGFWVNRLLMPYLNEAVALYEEGVSIESVDSALEEFGLPMGPLALLDQVGLDVAVKVGAVLGEAFPERMTPNGLIRRLESTGRMGKKSGSGFYTYEGKDKSPDRSLRAELGLPESGSNGEEESVFGEEYLVSRCLYPMVNEAALALEDNVVGSAGDGDLALVMGMGWPPFRGGLLRWADEIGLARIVDRLDEWSAAIDPRFTPTDSLRERSRWQAGFYTESASGPEAQPSLGEPFE